MRLNMLALGLLPLAVAAAAPPESKPVQVADQPKQVCKRTETTGTRLGSKRVCMSKADWDAEAELAKDEIRRTTELGSASTPR